MIPRALSLAALLLWTACAPGREPASPPAREEDGSRLDQAQWGLPEIRLWLGAAELSAEVASTRQQIATGMMHRTEMGEQEAMLFVFARPYRASFYMRNTRIPLSCAYIHSDGTILEIHDMEPMDETEIEASSQEVRYVLEVNRGWFGRHGVGVGTVVATERGSLEEAFFGR